MYLGVLMFGNSVRQNNKKYSPVATLNLCLQINQNAKLRSKA